MKNVVFYATDTMSDWEYGYVLAGLASRQTRSRAGSGSWSPRQRAGDQVRSIGGLTVVPDTTLDAVGDAGPADPPRREHLGRGPRRGPRPGPPQDSSSGGLVAAICGAPSGWPAPACWTTASTPATRPTTSPGSTGYHGTEHYREAKVVTDRGVITAPATAPVDFARAVFEALEVFPPKVLNAWYGLYTTGERHYFDALVGA